MSTPAISIALQDLANGINEALAEITGEPVAFVVVLQYGGAAQYVSNVSRKDGTELIESLIARWKAGRADIPAHYNPDLKTP